MLEKVKQMFKHLWGYYKADIFSLFVLFMLVMMPTFFSRASESNPSVNIYEVNRPVDQSEIKQKVMDYYTLRKEQGDDVEIHYDDSMRLSLDEPDFMELEYMVRFTGLIAAKEIDLLISDETIIEHYARQGGFLDLEEVLPLTVQEDWKDDLIYIEDATGSKRAYAVRLQEANKQFAAILVNSEDKRATLNILSYLQSQYQ